MPSPNTPGLSRSRSRLAALGEKKPGRKSAQVRALWPEIRTAIEKGHTLREVSECLKEDGITISATTLGSYISRIRKKGGAMTVASQVPVVQPLPAKGLAAPSGIPESSFGDRPKLRDPLANVRESEGKRQVFDYRPEQADPKKLI